MIDVFGIVADIFVSHSFGTHCIDTDLRTVLQWRHFSRDSIPKDSDKQDGDDGEGQGNPAPFQKAASDWLYTRFIPSKKGSVLR